MGTFLRRAYIPVGLERKEETDNNISKLVYQEMTGMGDKAGKKNKKNAIL